MSQIKLIKDNTRAEIKEIREIIADSLRAIDQETGRIERAEAKLCELQDTLLKLEGVPE